LVSYHEGNRIEEDKRRREANRVEKREKRREKGKN
jgi:hypothetical protein